MCNQERYNDMYQSLFQDISNVLEFLEQEDGAMAKNVAGMLKDAQRKTEDMFIDGGGSFSEDKLFEKVLERTNLQAIGYYVKEGSTLKKSVNGSLTQRSYAADETIQHELEKFLDEETIEKIYPAITNYLDKKEEIQFSLGMKVGAKLALMLTANSEYDY